MKIIMYGTEICINCVEALGILGNRADVELEYRDITEKIATLKEFLSYRDNEDIFAPIIKSGKVGIPLFILEDGTKTLELSDFIKIDQPSLEQSVDACSLDGSCHC